MNQKLTLNPDAESSDDVAMPSDDAVRQALLRMGSGKQRPGGGNGGSGQNQHDRPHDRQSVFPHGGGGQRRGGEQMQAAASSPDARRRRFSQNEHVPVEYVSRDRPARSGDTLRLDNARDASEPADDRTGFLERELERERQGRAAAERAAEENKTALTAARTRIAHLEIDLQEARAQRQAMIDLAQSAAQAASQAAAQQSAAQHAAASQQADARAAARAASLASLAADPPAADPLAAEPLDAADEEDDVFAPSLPATRRGRGRPRRLAVPVQADAEPEPVKWWSDD